MSAGTLVERADFDRIAAAYPPEAAATPAWERKRYLSPLQQAAWEYRFASHGRSAEAALADCGLAFAPSFLAAAVGAAGQHELASA